MHEASTPSDCQVAGDGCSLERADEPVAMRGRGTVPVTSFVDHGNRMGGYQARLACIFRQFES